MKTYMKGLQMQQISISEIQRNLHKLDAFDIVEIIDKKRHKVKGYFLDSKYMAYIDELIKREKQSLESADKLAGSLHQYANKELRKQEEGSWQCHVEGKYSI